MTDNISWNNVPDGELFKWNTVGAKVEGALISRKVQNNPGKAPGHVYEVQTKNGIVTFFAPSLLHKKLEKLALPTAVRITYEKESKTKTGNTLKEFKVDFAPATPETLKMMGIELLNQSVSDIDEINKDLV